MRDRVSVDLYCIQGMAVIIIVTYHLKKTLFLYKQKTKNPTHFICSVGERRHFANIQAIKCFL